MVGTTEDYAEATSKQEWELALIKGDLHGLQSFDNKETIVLSPYNNTEYLNVAAYLEAFWATLCHNNVPPHEEWTTNLHGGLKEFIDHAVSTLGRTHLKPTTECLRGVATYPTGDSTQGRYKMTLSHLKNEHYAIAVREAMMEGETSNLQTQTQKESACPAERETAAKLIDLASPQNQEFRARSVYRHRVKTPCKDTV